MTKSSCWSITINNPTDDDWSQWNSLTSLPFVKQASGQLERGDNDTPHIQGCVVTQYGRFFEKLKQALPRAHIEPAKNKNALVNYVRKEDTRIGNIPTVRTATVSDVQRECVQAFVRAIPYDYERELSECDNLEQFVILYAATIRREAEAYLDMAIRKLIREGYYGVEFVMANHQVRDAYKRYFPEIVVRYLRSQNAEQSAE